MRRKVATALVVALAFGFGGCGGSARTEVVSKQVAVKRLEAACLAGQRAGQASARRATDKLSYVQAMRDQMQTILDRVDSVEPADHAARRNFDTYKATLRDRLGAIDRIMAGSRTGLMRAVARERHLLDTSYIRGREAIFALGARHVCV